MNLYLQDFFSRSATDVKTIKQNIDRIRKKPPKNLDTKLHILHDYYSEKINCLDCAQCCKSISPAVSYSDIERLAKHLKTKTSHIIDSYFIIDSDNDYVFTSQPCPFLMDDNYCNIYTSRPRACKEYPHTDRRRAYQILQIHAKNIDLCPIVYQVFKNLQL
jgi:Fe-S-cluster containining protein